MKIGKLETTPVDSSKLSAAVKNDLIKETEYDNLVKTLSNTNNTDTNDLIRKSWLWHKNWWNWKENTW